MDPSIFSLSEGNGVMLILGLMAVGILIGLKCFPQKYAKLNSKIQLACTGFLIFCMGVSLGRRESFFEDLFLLGWQSFLLAIIPIVFSVLAVYVLSRIVLEKKNGKEKRGE